MRPMKVVFLLPRWALDASRLLFEDCLFEGNVAQGVGAAGHLTGSVAP